MTSFDYDESFDHQFNSMGEFTYSDSEHPEGSFEMTGKLKVVDLPSVGNAASSDMVGSFIVPTEDLDAYTESFQDSGIKIYDAYDYTSPSGGEASLIVWTSTGRDVNSVLENLKEITTQLPYS
jgi:hypothetical protein